VHKTYRPILLLSVCLIVIQGCSYKNRNFLFNTPKKIKTSEPVYILNQPKDSFQVYRHRIKIGDRLVIRYLNNYDIGTGAGQSATSGANTSAGGLLDKGYLVNYDSTVILPMIGRIKLTGMTRLEASRLLEQEYSKYIINPIIEVNIANLGVTVLGEVNLQGRILIDKENTTLVDIIAMAGGIKDSGKKKNIKIIRGNQVILINLKKISVLESSAIIMQDNDIVYVEPYGAKAAAEPYVSVQPIVAIASAALQTTLFILQFYLIYKR
jgi:polysaccharide export outer membrane protein